MWPPTSQPPCNQSAQVTDESNRCCLATHALLPRRSPRQSRDFCKKTLFAKKINQTIQCGVAFGKFPFNPDLHSAVKALPRLLQLFVFVTDSRIKSDQLSSDPPSQGLSQPLSQFHSTGVSPRVRAHCIINLGRICFQNEKLAKKVVPAMARELETCQEESVRNNVLVVLTDLCLLQTQLVDP